MKNFKHTIMPGYLPDGRNGKKVPMHITIEYKDGKLALSGVVGAIANGYCWGSEGQCDKELSRPDFTPASEWDVDRVYKLACVWEAWHLNDMHPECEHQRELGWPKLATKDVTIYTWRLTAEARDAQRMAKRAALSAAKRGDAFTPTPQQVQALNLEDFSQTTTQSPPEGFEQFYTASDSTLFPHIKTLPAGHTHHAEYSGHGDTHPDGLLCKPCPVCGYEYGSRRNTIEVPEDVLKWLHNLPAAEVPCAWDDA